MSNTNRIVLLTDSNGVDPTGYKASIDSPTMFRRMESLLGRSSQGACSANMQLAYNPIAAQGKLTCTGTGTNTDTLSIGNVTITIVTSGATGNQVNVAASGTALGAAIAALVNTSASFTGICTASSSSGAITLTAAIPGTIGNGIQLSESSSSITLTSAFGALTAGTEGTSATFKMGL